MERILKYTNTVSLRLGLGIAGVCLLAGCATPASVQAPDTRLEAQARAFTVEPDRARIYFVNGTLSIFGQSHKYPSDVIIDGSTVGSMNQENALVIDVRPGTYEVSWKPRSTDPIDQGAAQKSLTVKLDAGAHTILKGDYSVGAALAFGLIGGLIAPPTASVSLATRSDIDGKTFVVPQNCTPQICPK
jgi:hypothetical protein